MTRKTIVNFTNRLRTDTFVPVRILALRMTKRNPQKAPAWVKDFPGPSKSGPMNCFNVFRVELKSSSIKSTGTSTRMSDNDQDTIIEGSSPPGHPTSVTDEPKLKYKSWKYVVSSCLLDSSGSSILLCTSCIKEANWCELRP